LKHIINKLKKNWIRVWLIIIAVACISFVGIAAYTEVSSVKRVISTKDSSGQPFSSNCMKSENSSRRMTSSSFFVTVCNFDQNYPEKISSADITYILKAELLVQTAIGVYTPMSSIQTELNRLNNIEEVNRTQEEKDTIILYNRYITKAANYSIQKTADDDIIDPVVDASERRFVTTDENGNVSITDVIYGTDGNSSTYQKLKAKKSATDIYTVVIDNEDINTREEPLFFVQLTATPKSGIEYSSLKVRLYGTKEAVKDEVSWSGYISDPDYSYSGVDYDFYNYVITGSGEGTLDILWDPTNINVNKFFLVENKLADQVSQIESNDPLYGEAGTKAHCKDWNKVSLNVDSDDSRFELQLYKTVERSSINPDSYIKCFFREKESPVQQGE